MQIISKTKRQYYFPICCLSKACFDSQHYVRTQTPCFATMNFCDQRHDQSRVKNIFVSCENQNIQSRLHRNWRIFIYEVFSCIVRSHIRLSNCIHSKKIDREIRQTVSMEQCNDTVLLLALCLIRIKYLHFWNHPRWREFWLVNVNNYYRYLHSITERLKQPTFHKLHSLLSKI